MQQYGEREDFPFTYFGMYKNATKELGPYHRYEILLKDNERTLDILKLSNNAQTIKSNLDLLILKNHSPIRFSESIPQSSLKENEVISLNKYLKDDLILKLISNKKIKKEGILSAKISFWRNLSQRNRNTPDYHRVIHTIRIQDLLKYK